MENEEGTSWGMSSAKEVAVALTANVSRRFIKFHICESSGLSYIRELFHCSNLSENESPEGESNFMPIFERKKEQKKAICQRYFECTFNFWVFHSV